MKRRDFLKSLGILPLGLTGCQYLHSEGFVNPCLRSQLPKHLREHDLVQSAWEGINASKVWDVHTHLIGIGDSDEGAWVNPNMQSSANLWRYIQFNFYINGSCADPDKNETMDLAYVNRLLQLHNDMPEGFRFMLLAFDYYYNEKGEYDKAQSVFYTPNRYVLKQVKKYPGQFKWIASIHPYREDSVEELAFVKKMAPER